LAGGFDLRRKVMIKRILPLLLIAVSSPHAASAASAPAVPDGAALRAEMCFSWRLWEGPLAACLGEMRGAATDAERQAVARRFHPDYRLPAGTPGEFGRPPRNAGMTQQPR
jgi:hypothetical protein